MVVLKCYVSVCRECTWQDRDESKDTFEGFIENITHLVLEILGCDEGIQEIPSIGSFHGDDFTTGACDVGIKIESFPEMVEGFSTGTGTTIEKDADIGLEDRTEGLEEPTMRVD